MERYLFLLQVGNEPTVYHQTQDNLLWSSKDLKIQVGGNFPNASQIKSDSTFSIFRHRFFRLTISMDSWYSAARLKWGLTMLTSPRHHSRRRARSPFRNEVRRFLFAQIKNSLRFENVFYKIIVQIFRAANKRKNSFIHAPRRKHRIYTARRANMMTVFVWL